MKKINLMMMVFLLSLVSTAADISLFDVRNSKPEHYQLLGKKHASYRVEEDRIVLVIPRDPSDRWPGVILKPQQGRYFNLSGGSVLAVDVKNLNQNPAQLQIDVVNLGTTQEFDHLVTGGIGLEPGETATLRLRYGRTGNCGATWAPGGLLVTFDGFDGKDHQLVTDQVDQLRFYIKDGEIDQRFELSNFRLESPPLPLSTALNSPESFYPCIDRFGQYRHLEWPGKLHDGKEFASDLIREEEDLRAHPGVADRTEFGGWASGPSYPATGHFYPVKHEGKWYLVDPTGKLFWSMGITSVYLWAHTGLALRENYFEQLPAKSGPEQWAWGRTAKPIQRWYKEKGIQETEQVNFVQFNLLRKDGGTPESAYRAFLERTPRRLKSWGINTIGNWSDEGLVRLHKLPYAVSVYTDVTLIQGDRGWWHNFYEVFHPDFPATLAANIRKWHQEMIDDPYCIGFFVSNELSWGDALGLVRGVLRSPADQPSKRALCERLQVKYGSIDALNQAWGSRYDSWNAFLNSTVIPDETRAGKDLEVFNEEMIERYFSTIHDVLRETAPNKLYLGCRFPNEFRPEVVRIAAKYVDVLSFNLYKYSVGSFRLPEGVDKPVVIGEYHFGTTQYGPPSPGLCATADQQERARAFDRYLRSALWHPNIIGAHHFAYYDQAATGRPMDCENMQFGFLSVVDRPYPELVEAARTISEQLYSIRSR